MIVSTCFSAKKKLKNLSSLTGPVLHRYIFHALADQTPSVKCCKTVSVAKLHVGILRASHFLVEMNMNCDNYKNIFNGWNSLRQLKRTLICKLALTCSAWATHDLAAHLCLNTLALISTRKTYYHTLSLSLYVCECQQLISPIITPAVPNLRSR